MTKDKDDDTERFYEINQNNNLNHVQESYLQLHYRINLDGFVQTVYCMNHAHNLLVFTIIIHYCFADTGAIVWLHSHVIPPVTVKQPWGIWVNA